jgi:hypothetical protein
VFTSVRLQTVLSLHRLRQGADAQCQDCALVFRTQFYTRDYDENRKFAVVQMSLAEKSSVARVKTAQPCFLIHIEHVQYSSADSNSCGLFIDGGPPTSAANLDLAEEACTERALQLFRDGTIYDHLIPVSDWSSHREPDGREHEGSCTSFTTSTGNQFTMVPWRHIQDMDDAHDYEVFNNYGQFLHCP